MCILYLSDNPLIFINFFKPSSISVFQTWIIIKPWRRAIGDLYETNLLEWINGFWRRIKMSSPLFFLNEHGICLCFSSFNIFAQIFHSATTTKKMCRNSQNRRLNKNFESFRKIGAIVPMRFIHLIYEGEFNSIVTSLNSLLGGKFHYTPIHTHKCPSWVVSISTQVTNSAHF